MAIPPDAIARAIAFAIEQPAAVDVNEIIVRPYRADLGADGLALVEHARGQPADQGEHDDPHEAEPAVGAEVVSNSSARSVSMNGVNG